MDENVYFKNSGIEPYCADCDVEMDAEGHCIRCYRYECPDCGYIWYP